MIGTLLGNRYEILERIGSGGMAHVYKARCRLLNRDVAVKILRDELSENAEFLDRFKVEAQAAASLSHPNIVSVFDVGEERGIYYFVMEYIEGQPLKDYITANGALEYREAVKIILQVMSAIEHAHKKCIIHRDIKPHNILITKEGIAKVTDFGIARAVFSDATMVKGSNIIGSVHYFSPEQARGMEVDFKSDIYSIGIVLYELLTGRVPFNADSPFEVAKMQVEEMPEPPSEIIQSIPKSIDGVVLKAMAKSPKLRYPTVTAMIEELNAVMENPDIKMDNEDIYATRVIPVVTVDEEPEREKGKKGKKKKADLTPKEREQNKKAVVWAWITSVIIILGIAAAIALPKFIKPVENTEEFTVPDVEGHKLSDLKERYDETEIIFTEGSRDFSDKYAEGYVISQSPAKDEKYTEKPLKITVTISKGAKNIVLEDYTGKNAETVKKELELEGLVVTVKNEKHESFPIDVIIKTSPSKGSEMRSGDTVTLYVSLGPDQTSVKVPSVADMTEENAKNTLKAAGLVPDMKYQYSSQVEKGRVISQKPEASTQLPEKSTVTVHISLGEEPRVTEAPIAPVTQAPADNMVTVKGFVGMKIEDARAEITALGLTVGSVGYKDDATYPKGSVTSQSPSQGSKVPKGTVINLTVSNGGQQ